MFGVKVLLGTAAFSALLCALLLLWNEEAVTCGFTTLKCLESMFVFSAIVLAVEYAKLDNGHEQEV